MGRWLRLGCVLLVWLAALPQPPAVAATPSAMPGADIPADWWVRLSDRSVSNELTLTLAPDWPSDPLILATSYNGRGYSLSRSTDGARTWETLLWPGASVAAIAPRHGDIRPLFAHQFMGGLLRSANDGASWEGVGLSGVYVSGIAFAPTFSEDGLALLTGRDRDQVAGATPVLSLFLSRDAGARWERVEALAGVAVRQVAFSPSFAIDRTILIATASGVAISTDGGASWSAPTRLAVEDGEYANVLALAASPSFAADGTLLAVAAASEGGGAAALLRSRDRGLSWQRVHALSLARPSGASVAFSPSFAADGIALVAARESVGQTVTCEVVRSSDRGDSWQQTSGVRDACGSLHLLRTGDALVGMQRNLWSLDGGATWERPADPGGLRARQIVPSPAFADDRFMFVVAQEGGPAQLWAVGPNARAEYGPGPCLVRPTGGFGRLLDAESEVRTQLGCPTGYEQPTEIRERETEEGRLLWIAGSPFPSELRAGRPEGWPAGWVPGWDTLRTLNEPDAPRPDGADVIAGAWQAFEQGQLLFIPRPDGRRTILVLVRNSWREFPDPAP